MILTFPAAEPLGSLPALICGGPGARGGAIFVWCVFRFGCMAIRIWGGRCGRFVDSLAIVFWRSHLALIFPSNSRTMLPSVDVMELNDIGPVLRIANRLI